MSHEPPASFGPNDCPVMGCYRTFVTGHDLDEHLRQDHTASELPMIDPNKVRVTGFDFSEAEKVFRDEDLQQVSASGAKSSGHKPAYHLVPFSMFLERLARRYAGPPGGAAVYGEDNWKKGLADREYALDRANHTLEHLLLAIEEFKAGKRGPDDNLAAVIWGAIFMMGCQEAQGHARTTD